MYESHGLQTWLYMRLSSFKNILDAATDDFLVKIVPQIIINAVSQ